MQHAHVCLVCEVVGPVLDCTLAQHVFGLFRILANDHGMAVPDVRNEREVQTHARSQRLSEHFGNF